VARVVSGNIVTVTKLPDTERCGWCHRPLVQSPGPGRRRTFCCRSHRQRAYEARRRADRFGLPADQVVVTEADLRRLHDRLYQLETALQDVDADLAEDDSPKAVRAALAHLVDPARDLVGVVIEPVRI
jgi:hypothetical protein